MKTPLEYGKLACDTFMDMYLPEELPPTGTLFYHQGVLLSGMQRIYLISGEKKYFDYIKAYVDSVIGENGEIIGFCHVLNNDKTPSLAKQALTMLDHKQPSILFYNLYDETGEKKYLNAIKVIAESMYFWPVNDYGGYWHMMTQHNQMWLDGAYMAGPLSVMYAKKFNDDVLQNRAINQIFLMDAHMKDKTTGLYYHGWDASKEAAWADKQTGLSGQIWGRAVAWYVVAILDMLDYISPDHPDVCRLRQIVRDLLKALARVQDGDSGMWYEVLDKPGYEGNWTESSCTNLFVYSYAKAIRKGIINMAEYGEIIEKAYEGSINSTYIDNRGNLIIDKICAGTCIEEGTYEHYISCGRVQNDLHGGGAFILMCSEMEKYRCFAKDSVK